MKDLDWTILQLFLHVARTGGLSGAARLTGLSPATVGRHMLDLEGAVGRPLFLRSQTGYRLTEEGEMLLGHLGEMEGGARLVEDWRSRTAGRSLVRIACGTWFAWWLAQNLGAIIGRDDSFQLDLVIGESRARLAHRESDIGLRAVRPTEENLAAVKLGPVAYAAYRAGGNGADGEQDWVAVSRPNALSRYLMYPHAEAAGRIAATVSTPRAMADLAGAGLGRAVLPCFVGDLDPRLQRAGGEIPALRHTQWLVMNNDDRHRPEIRLVADRMIGLVRRQAGLFAGQSV